MQNINNNTKSNKGQIARSVRFDIAPDKTDEFHERLERHGFSA